MKKLFKDSATAEDIMRDGWMRGFKVEQTFEELQVMDYYRDTATILEKWGQWDEEMQKYFNNGN
jgi:hypothetical protein